MCWTSSSAANIRIWETGSDTPLATSRGIHRGSSTDDIIAAYGKHHYNRSEQGMNIIGYIDKKTKRTLEFWIVEDMVTAMRLDYAEMN